MTPVHEAIYTNVRHDFFRICVFISGCSLLSNFLPAHDKFKQWPLVHAGYRLFVDLIAAAALNIRVSLPSLDLEILGFRKQVRHGYRNWRQDRMDRRYLR